MWSIAIALTLASSIFIDDQMSSASSRANAPLGATFQAGYAVYGNGTWAVEFFTINTSSGPAEWIVRRSLITPEGREQVKWAYSTNCPVVPDVALSLNRLPMGFIYVPELSGRRLLFSFPPPSAPAADGRSYALWGIALQGGGFADYRIESGSGTVAAWAAAAESALEECWTSS